MPVPLTDDEIANIRLGFNLIGMALDMKDYDLLMQFLHQLTDNLEKGRYDASNH